MPSDSAGNPVTPTIKTSLFLLAFVVLRDIFWQNKHPIQKTFLIDNIPNIIPDYYDYHKLNYKALQMQQCCINNQIAYIC